MPETVKTSEMSYKAPTATNGQGKLGGSSSSSFLPSISLPKGGGAIRGIGEKFSANPVTGTGSLNVPIFTSPGRSGFGPQLSLSYDSGSGNGPFGFGWSLSLPSITRKTDKGLPKYQDNANDDLEEEDVFILSGAEDLVPVFRKDEDGEWMHDEEGNYILEEEERDGYDVRQYRPRMEGLFARIERWTDKATGDVHWRSISKDNILTVYGKDEHSRIAEPAAEEDDDESQQQQRRIFSWLICQSYDDKGNAILYEYSAENNEGLDLSQANERNRVRTANRYIKRILYGNRQPLLLDITRPSFRKSHIEQIEEDFSTADWMFEVVFDYGEDHYKMLPLDNTIPEDEQHQLVEASSSVPSSEGSSWSSRPDPFSTYRAGFEVRTYRRCQRVLMFHRFPELGSEPYLVRSTEFDYSDFDHSSQQHSDISLVKNELEHGGSTRFASFIQAVVQSGYVRNKEQPINVVNGVNYLTYLKKSLPALEFEYSKATINEEIRELDAASLENLPYGLDNTNYQFVDLDGEGLSGILTEQSGAWFYKRNVSSGLPVIGGGEEEDGKPVNTAAAQFAPVERLKDVPSPGNLGSGRQQLMDLSGDGQLDLVQFNGPLAGFFERTTDEKWETFTPFNSLPNIRWDDPNLRFIDLTGDGHADILITEDHAFFWYPSLAEEGFANAKKVYQSLDEEEGPQLVFADGTQSIYLADMSGDGLTDLVRIRNGEVCYWPNLGYGRFGAKVTMDNAPCFDAYDRFDQKRIRLADIDGTGVTDIIYLGGRRNGVQIYFNQSGNRWSDAYTISNFPDVDNLSSSIQAIDLLGTGTACLVWSSILPGNFRRQMRYIDLMGVRQEDEKEKEEEQGPIKVRQKPHLLVGSKNNLGAETKVHYAPSTKFYLEDKREGKPWITRLPFPVHVVERVETYDCISRNRFVTHYAYHHGYFDGDEREFRGFGMVEQWDTEEFAVLSDSEEFFPLLPPTNIEASSYVPPVYTKTWFHTGIYFGRDHVSNFFAGQLDPHDRGEYYREPAWQDDDIEARKHMLDDTLLPAGLSVEEEHEACRALKGSMLHQEVYALDGTDKAQHPYTVTEQNFALHMLQPHGYKNKENNRHAVFFTHSKEIITYHYERNPTDPRISHALTLKVDEFGNALKQVAIGYGRLKPDFNLPLKEDRDKQRLIQITCTENMFTNPVIDKADAYHTPLPAETRTYELRKPEQEMSGENEPTKLYQFEVLLGHVNQAGDGSHDIDYEDIDFNKAKETVENDEEQNKKYFRRLIELVRTLYRKNDLAALLSLGELESLALQGESYKLAFTPGLLAEVFQRDGQALLTVIDPDDPNNVLGGDGPGQSADRGGYVSSQQLKAEGKFPNTDPDNHWWIPNGRVFYSPNSSDTASQELDYAHQHFFLPRRYRDPFHTNSVSTESFVTFDAYDLLMLESRDQVGNHFSVGERKPGGQIDPKKPGNDYRVLQPRLVTDPNRNRAEVLFDALGMVAGTAVKGKNEESVGDTLNDGFEPDLTQAQLDGFYDVSDPHEPAPNFLKGATTRIIHDLDRFRRTQEAHPKDEIKWLPVYAATLARETHVSDLPQQPPDGLEIQISISYSDGFGREIQRKIQAEPGPLVEGGPVVSPRWVGSGWTVFNNKGKPVRQYEPFFSQLPPEKRHHFEFGMQVGVSPILFYDPVGRVVATLHPNHTYEKAVFDPWQQVVYDVNDTVAAHGTQTGNPHTDPDIHGYVAKYLATLNDDPITWQTWLEQRQSGDLGPREQAAADRAVAHTDTPSTTYFDTLGGPFLTMVHNRFEGDEGTSVDETYATRVEVDMEGNQRRLRDAIVENGDTHGRIVMEYDYDMLGNRIHQLSMDAGERWMLNDVVGKPIRAWDSRGHTFRTAYDPLRRPLHSFVTGADPANPDQELLTERLVYGEQHPQDEQHNLRGRVHLHLDQAGMMSNEDYDFKGNLLGSSRRLAKQYKQTVDWRAVDENHVALPISATAKLHSIELKAALAPLLGEDDDNNTFSSSTLYDALNRPIQIIFPHTSKQGTTLNVTQPVYNEANLLERVDAWLELNTEPATLLDPSTATQHFVKNIDYNAKGQRKVIEYGNGVSTFYEYDPLTFRLVHVLTVRNALGFPDDCPQQLLADWPGCQVQNLHYTYDPVGNITQIRDDAQQTIFFRNKRVEPKAEYTYDAIYRLVKATGREHLGQVGGAPIPHSYSDVPRVGILHPNDGRAMGTYTESYIYDAVGNLLEIDHAGDEPSNPGWTRQYAYAETSLIEDGTGVNLVKISNRLSSTTVDVNDPSVETYAYDDDHGNMTHMPHLQIMEWDYKDQLCMTQRQKVNDEDEDGIKRQGERTYYVYDAAGQRMRKVTELASGSPKDERIYLGSFEVYHCHLGASSGLVRETLQIMDDKQRIALVETRNDVDDGTLKQLIRYQLSNHLGSAVLELDDQAKIISYEEYTPYGSTSYQAGRNQREVSLKRYRYTAKERDEETGLYYHVMRYYAPWLGRWSSTDPAGIEGGINLFEYARSNPIMNIDPSGMTGQLPSDLFFENPEIDPSEIGAEEKGAEIGAGLYFLSPSAGKFQSITDSPVIIVPPNTTPDPKPVQKAPQPVQKGPPPELKQELAKYKDIPETPIDESAGLPADAIADEPADAIADEPAELPTDEAAEGSESSLKDNPVAQFLAGAAVGGLQGWVPFGIVGNVVNMPTKYSELGRGVGEVTMGLLQIVGGGGAAFGGGAAAAAGAAGAPATGGASLLVTLAGGSVAAAGVATVVQGSSNVLAGVSSIINSLSMRGGDAEGVGGNPTPRSPHPIGKRIRLNTMKEAREAAERASPFGKAVKHTDGPGGPHFHPADNNGRPLNHDHYYFPERFL